MAQRLIKMLIRLNVRATMQTRHACARRLQVGKKGIATVGAASEPAYAASTLPPEAR
jgi:hypothetical protein